MGDNNGVAVGIDLGTTYSCVGIWLHDRVEIIANDQGNRTTPSCVAFTETERFIGDAARNQAARNPANTIFGHCLLLLPLISPLLQPQLRAKMGNNDGVAVGIDLGTTYSCIGVWLHDRVEIIANDQGNRTTPSCVAFTETERFVGDAARNQAAANPVNTIFDAKRLIGRRFMDSTVQSDTKLWPFKTCKNPGKENELSDLAMSFRPNPNKGFLMG
ncbi:hypothetical protein POM88_019307 [Heracleum sosnowskyi]|uniref:Heat shock protein 70 n=1 Tax=Heracleum sosnowskyi TaxID=360622 RepID=A0AAD8MZQ5_9APIA|nr:hypothetical protein POM88_019307 [Heracleum sosnowskyi]